MQIALELGISLVLFTGLIVVTLGMFGDSLSDLIKTGN